MVLLLHCSPSKSTRSTLALESFSGFEVFVEGIELVWVKDDLEHVS